MAGASLPIATITVEDEGLLRELRRLEAAAGNLRPAFREMGEYLMRSTRERFAAQQDPGGRAWAALSPAYQRRKKKHPELKLVLDGFLRDLMRYQAGPSSLAFGTDRIYGATHQFGDPRRHIPARPYLGLSVADRDELVDITLWHLRRA